jgi:hypothetical protein
VAEQQLDLLEVAAGGAAEFGAGAAQIVGAEQQAELGAVCADEGEHRLGRQGRSVEGIGLRNGTEEAPGTDACGHGPAVERLFDPGGQGHGADAAVLAAQIDQHPAALSLLDVCDG